MESKEDRFYQYLLLYKQIVGENILPIFGKFFYNNKNIICSFKIYEFENFLNCYIPPYVYSNSNGVPILEFNTFM